MIYRLHFLPYPKRHLTTYLENALSIYVFTDQNSAVHDPGKGQLTQAELWKFSQIRIVMLVTHWKS